MDDGIIEIKCEFCPNVMKNSKKLLTQQRQINPNQMFIQCKKCNQLTPILIDLKYCCSYCSLEFDSHKELLIHIRDQHSEKFTALEELFLSWYV